MRYRYHHFAWAVLAYNLLVILWGAFVRATGSGAGCGSHWPDCNGELVPRAETVETAIELTHRLTSGLAALAVVMLVLGAYARGRSAVRGETTPGDRADDHSGGGLLRVLGRVRDRLARLVGAVDGPYDARVRMSAAASLLFMIIEAALGAGLVLLEMVGQNQSPARAAWVATHLINTHILVACLALTAHFSAVERGKMHPRGAVSALIVGAVLMLTTGALGAVTALGDTLFPATSLAQGLAADVDANSHVLVRMRIWHPVVAVATFLYVSMSAGLLVAVRPDASIRRTALVVVGVMVLQLGVGLANVALLAPVAVQLVHLFLADLGWVAFVIFCAQALRVPPRQAATVLERSA